MRFEVSERFKTKKSINTVMDILEEQLQKTASYVDRKDNKIEATSIEATFGSINRNDKTTFRISKRERSLLCVAEVTYKPSGWFWVILILCLFTYILWLIPIGMYLYQKNTVRESIQNTLIRVRNEVEA